MRKLYFSILLFLPVLIFGQTALTSGITPDLSAYGEAVNYPGEGEYEIFLSPDNILDKPIIVVDGFDPGDARDIPGLYSLLDFNGSSGTQNLADLVRAQGFDVVILNFPVYVRTADGATVDGGADFMERNAMLLVELLDIINTAKAANSPEENVIIGPSMGGIITRYALNYMEANTLDTDTRLYISFDSPHHGANVPIGLQHQLNYLAFNDLNPVPEVQPLINSLLKSPAARQLLVDHFETHLQSGSTVEFDPALTLPQPHPFRTTFEASINSFTSNGFPQNTRNISIINGSGIGSTYLAADGVTPITNGFTIVDTSIPVDGPFGPIDVEVEIYMTPPTGAAQQISRFYAPVFPPFIVVESTASSGTTNFDGVDSAPGGLFDLSGLTGDLGGGGGLAAEFLAALQIDKFSFIPSVSALALDITDEATGDDINWHHSIDLAGRATTNDTPFDNTFLPDDNEPHVQLTEDNVNFALVEILTPPLSVSGNDRMTFQLEKNPIENELVLLSNRNTYANISIVDVTGKMVFNSTTSLGSRTSIPVKLTSGFYIVNVRAENNETFTTKFLAN
ncbi:T9SS type A sorting domain-containing protein [Winogradskyella ouciana]|uniref:T9SS type A sorting domain-containing protein n=1 Tax=Winogradskyella ouciana TaxID=2608631 RepID=A0A7K1GBT2_9FLAO|nr:T9SS type A sorting domain-containing protein [Winogradskyella ouciana]MTE26581.1 T9SS type A sorting domain-containing protein [Winogradskyella ouciana]